MGGSCSCRNVRNLILICFIDIFLTNVAVSVQENPYSVLGVKRTAPSVEIKRAYKKLARQWHPDKNQDPKAQETFVKINAAYEILSDEKKRSQYDKYGEMGESHNGNTSPFSEFRRGSDGGFSFVFQDMPFSQFFSSSHSSSKLMLTTHIFKNTILPESHHKPFMIYVYGDWCFECMQTENLWDSIASDFEAIGIGVYELHYHRNRHLADQMGIRNYPLFIGVVNGRAVKYRSNEISNVALRNFISSLLPYGLVQTLISETSLQFFQQSFKDNKPQVLLFTSRINVPLLFEVVAFEFKERLAFAYVNSKNFQTTSLKAKYNIQNTEPTLVILKEEPSQPEVIVRASSLKHGAVRKVASENLFFFLPRLSSQNIFDELCPVTFLSERWLCVVLFNSLEQDHSSQRFTLRLLPKDLSWKTKNVNFLFVDEDKQNEFVASFQEPSELDECPDKSTALKLLVLWRTDQDHVTYDWFPGGWCGGNVHSSGLRTELEIMIDNVVQKKTELAQETTLGPIADEHGLSIYGYLLEKSYGVMTYILDSFDSPVWNHPASVASFVIFLCFIVMLSVVLPMAGEFNGTDKNPSRSKPKSSESQSVLGLAKLCPANQKQLVINSPPGQYTVVLLLDAESADEAATSPLIQAFADAIYGYTGNTSYVFTWLSMQEQLMWCTEIMEVNQFGEIVPGTVIAINGHKKYIYIFKPRLLLPGFSEEDENKLTGRFIGLEDSEEEEGEADSMNPSERRKQKIGAVHIRRRLPTWLERLYEGTLKDKKELDQWPKMEP